MPETFTPFTWADGSAGGTPITAAQINRIETGLESVDDRVAALEAVPSSTRTASYSFVVADSRREQVYDSTSAGTFTLPANATQAIPVGEWIPLRQTNTGQLTIAAADGVTLQARADAFKLAGQHAVAQVQKTATDTWVLFGDITS